ncbi:Arylacetamide deacetylase [Ceraceosorus bombacis]|uniref:Arylacetamide deacetylase n=1 Tax=Ceraceosorus bombacis TaxID=401625 RepID=A0A0N7LB58_9BASI|nr:Arylacetamide deacetylase [Ceraceosorus bombacis]
MSGNAAAPQERGRPRSRISFSSPPPPQAHLAAASLDAQGTHTASAPPSPASSVSSSTTITLGKPLPFVEERAQTDSTGALHATAGHSSDRVGSSKSSSTTPSSSSTLTSRSLAALSGAMSLGLGSSVSSTAGKGPKEDGLTTSSQSLAASQKGKAPEGRPNNPRQRSKGQMERRRVAVGVSGSSNAIATTLQASPAIGSAFAASPLQSVGSRQRAPATIHGQTPAGPSHTAQRLGLESGQRGPRLSVRLPTSASPSVPPTSSSSSTRDTPRRSAEDEELKRQIRLALSSAGNDVPSLGAESRSAWSSSANQDSTTGTSALTASSPPTFIGGLYFTDCIFIALVYGLNLLRTCSIAELGDVVCLGIVYLFFKLPTNLARRRTLDPDAGDAIRPGDRPAKLSAFHHTMLLLVRFMCGCFPHLFPRILFAEQTIGPFVYWRTGGGSADLVRAFDAGLQSSPSKASRNGKEKVQREGENFSSHSRRRLAAPGFKAFEFSTRPQASSPQKLNAGASPTTLFYLHGGGFSLGSVAFYAEALIRLRNKLSALETANSTADHEARVVAVEYSLSPTSLFPVQLLQCLRCYAHLIEKEGQDASRICIAGDSAGGNLAMSLLLVLSGAVKEERLNERDWTQLPLPGKALLISPWTDLRPHASLALSAEVQRRRQVKGFHWDYVTPHALQHFAQVYTGALDRPRRVAGPLGYVARLSTFGQRIGQPTSARRTSSSGSSPDSKHGNGGGRTRRKRPKNGPAAQRSLVSTLATPVVTLSRLLHTMLSEPLFVLIGAANGQAPQSTEPTIGIHDDPEGSGLDPLFPADERSCDIVTSPEDLSRRMDDSKSAFIHPEARDLLENHPLISPAKADWTRVPPLEGGMYVTWGKHETLAYDIEEWVSRVRDGHASSHADQASIVPQAPDQDKDELSPVFKQTGLADTADSVSGTAMDIARLQAERAVQSHIERGAGGVHAWPFVNMYLASSHAERERGLDLLAQFIANPSPKTPVAPEGQGLALHLGSPAPSHESVRLASSEKPSLAQSLASMNVPADTDADVDLQAATDVDPITGIPLYSPGSMPSDTGEGLLYSSEDNSNSQSDGGLDEDSMEGDDGSGHGEPHEDEEVEPYYTSPETQTGPGRSREARGGSGDVYLMPVHLSRPSDSGLRSSAVASAAPVNAWMASSSSTGAAALPEDLNPSYFGLSHYSQPRMHSTTLGLHDPNRDPRMARITHHPVEPEGLSDIAEEDSVLSGSVMSDGFQGGPLASSAQHTLYAPASGTTHPAARQDLRLNTRAATHGRTQSPPSEGEQSGVEVDSAEEVFSPIDSPAGPFSDEESEAVGHARGASSSASTSAWKSSADLAQPSLLSEQQENAESEDAVELQSEHDASTIRSTPKKSSKADVWW